MRAIHEDDTTCTIGEQRPGAVLLVLVVGTFLAPLDSSIVNIALPAISSDFGVGLSAVGWVTSAYLLTSATLLLPMGRLGDVWGLRPLYTWGLLVFGAGSLACAMAGSLETLVLSRVGQAVGAAMLFAAGPALVTRAFPPNRRGWALGYISLAVSAGLTAGPSLGGFLVGAFGWPSIFLINVPLTVVVAAIAWRLLPAECPDGGRLDLPGAVLAGGALLLMLLGLANVEANGVASLAVWAPIAVAAGLGAIFVWWQRRAPMPMVDLRLFSSRGFSAGIVSATLAYLALFAVTFTMPFYLLRVRGLAEGTAGLVLTVTPVAMALLAPTAGRLSDRLGSRGLASAGLLALAAGLLGLSVSGVDTPLWWAPAALVALGSGMAVFQTPNTAAVLRATPRAQAGVGSAFVAEARNVGMALGVALTAAIVGSAVGAQGLPGGTQVVDAATAGAFVSGMHAALRFAAGVALVSAAVSWFWREPDPVEAMSVKP